MNRRQLYIMKTNQDIKDIKNIIVDLTIGVIFAFILLSVFRPTIVNGQSMMNTLQPRNYLVIYKLAYIGEKMPERGDIIVFKSNLIDEKTGKNKLLIKRVVGLPNDEIRISGSDLFINDKKIIEKYIKDGETYADDNPIENETMVVPSGEFYCMGDNRNNSTDSRNSMVGTVSEDKIVGKAVVRLFPFNKIGLL